MNKKAFTLIELLAVIVILSIVGLITLPIITQNIEKSRIEMYRSNTQKALDAAKEYVSKNMKNNDFPSGGLEVTELDIKKDLQSKMPEYMNPRIKIVKEFPLNKNGKCDEKKLLEEY